MISRRHLLGAGLYVPLALRAAVAVARAQAPDPFLLPFGPRSPWRARPVDPVLGPAPPALARAVPWINDGAYGSAVFRARPSDPPVTVVGPNGQPGVWIADEIRVRPVVVPHFPAGIVPAKGSDGHCAIADVEAGLLHCFFQMRFDKARGSWTAGKYSLFALDGTGWGSPERPDGPTAAGAASGGGLLRAHEAQTLDIRHVLAAGAPASVLGLGPAWPATTQDGDAGRAYWGTLPLGTLLMLPPGFDPQRLHWPQARAIAVALKTYGARLIDRTNDTFGFAGEVGGGWSQATDKAGRWQNSWAEDLAAIRDSIRPVTATRGWIDADGHSFMPEAPSRSNLLSMRGPWRITGPGDAGHARYDMLSRRLHLSPTADTTFRTELTLRDMASPSSCWDWMKGCWFQNPDPSTRYRLQAEGTGEVSATLAVYDSGGGAMRSAEVVPGRSALIRATGIAWARTVVEVRAKGSGTLRLTLVAA